ncbi:MAG: nucleoside hydrolase [Gammaproteobacteria bacterium]
MVGETGPDKPLDVIFDTDLGVDDAMALLYLHASPHIKLRAICTGVGNATVAMVTRNCLYICERFGIEVPVYEGEGAGLDGTNRLPPPHMIHGDDGLGNINPVVRNRTKESLSAADYIVEAINRAPGEITVVTVGRLTNFALSLQRDPSIASKVKDVVVMGGAIGRHGHAGNVSPVAEANVFGDPLAADQVFGANMTTAMVGLDVTQEVFMGEDYFAELRDECGDAGRFIFDISRIYNGFHHEWKGLVGCYVHDSSATIYAVHPELFTVEKGQVRVQDAGVGAGQTIFSAGEQSWFVDEWRDRPQINVCTDVNAQAVLDDYMTVISRLT